MKLTELVDQIAANSTFEVLSKQEITEVANSVAMRFLRMSNGWDPTEDELFDAIQLDIVEACGKRAKERAERYAFGM